MDEALRELINAIKDLSPAIWEAALVQVRVQAWLNFGLAGVLLLVAIGLAYCAWLLFKTVEQGDTEGLIILCITIAILLLIPTIVNLYYGLLYLLSPDWAAIQLILEQVK